MDKIILWKISEKTSFLSGTNYQYLCSCCAAITADQYKAQDRATKIIFSFSPDYTFLDSGLLSPLTIGLYAIEP